MKYWGFNMTVVVIFHCYHSVLMQHIRTRACVLSVMITTVPLAQCAQLNRP